MKYSSLRFLYVNLLLAILSACSQPATTSIPTSPDATDAPVSQSTEGQAPITLAIDATTVLPALPTDKIRPLGPIVPIGIATDRRDGVGISFYGADGSLLGELDTPNMSGASPASIHIAGSYEGTLNFPLVFLASEGETQSLQVNTAGQILPLADISMMMGMIGIPGQPLLAFTSMEVLESSTGKLRNSIYLGDLSSLQDASPVLIVDESESRAAVPVAIRVEQGNPVGLWFTRRPWGIGGDIVFEPLEGLYYFDLQDDTVYEVLPAEATFSDIAPDQVWVAYSIWQENAPILNLRNLSTGQELDFPLLANSDRGAGAAMFSSAGYVAWMEARGSLAENNFNTTIRVATLEGTLIGEYPQSNFSEVAGLGEQILIEPIGWLNEQNLLVQVCTSDIDTLPVVVRVDVNTGEIAFLAPGTFVGFLHHP